jgi:hypothetical protein
VGRNSVLGIATRDGLNESGNRTPAVGQGGGGGGGIFFTRQDRALRLLQHNKYRLFFFLFKRPERDDKHLSSCSTEIKELVELYLYSNPPPFVLSWPVTG